MRIIVVGAGEVGSYVAHRLSREGHDVVVIDRSRRRLREIDDELDVMTVLGSGSSPVVLSEAGLAKTDLVAALTDDDEVNLIACMQAKQAGVAQTVARLQNADLRGRAGLDVRRAVGVDMVIDPDEEIADEILELISFLGATDVREMAGGEILLIGCRLGPQAPALGRKMSDIGKDYDPNWEFIFGTVTRSGETIIVRGDYTLLEGDLLRVVCKRRGQGDLMELLGLKRQRIRRVMLLGGGRTAEKVAKVLCRRGVEVAVVERNYERCQELSEKLANALVLHGDITEVDLLVEEEVGTYDSVVALTGEDDANILACLFAKAEGARETVAVVHRLGLLSLLDQIGIDAALSPRTVSANNVLRFVRGDVAQVATFLEGDVEVIELEVQPGTVAVGKSIADLGLNHEILVAAILRDGKAEIARGRSVIRVRDHVVVFASPELVPEVHRVFG
ncbi:MAG: Trk system potassium transporter TrkA [Acidimicrobiales bacterium]|nr:Trk system potassium transporter TrkA [Acidimicrobiales bacterium]